MVIETTLPSIFDFQTRTKAPKDADEAWANRGGATYTIVDRLKVGTFVEKLELPKGAGI